MQYRSFKIITFVLLGLLALYFISRGLILNKILESFSHQVKQSYKINIYYTKTGFTGFKTVYIYGLKMLSETGDTIVKSDTIFISPRLLLMLTGKMRVKEITINNTDIHLNISILRLFKPHHKITQKIINYAQLLSSLQNKFFTLLPKILVISNSKLTYRHDNIFSSVYCENFSYQKKKFSGSIVLSDNLIQKHCILEGIINQNTRKITTTIFHTDTSLVQIPYINERWQAFVGFDTLKLDISFKKMDATHFNIIGDALASRLAVKHESIGPEVVITKRGSIYCKVHVGDRYVELDSSSTIYMNRFSFAPYLRLEKYNSRKLTFAFIRKEFEAQDLFESLPSGLFANFQGIKTKGRLAYHLKVALNFDHPDSVQLDSKLENKGFIIKKYGVTDFRILNDAFNHEVYENDRYIKSILLGPDNPDFVPIQEISPYLKFSILTAEDGDFFYHHGFNQNAFREAIATNLKEHRFARGGSTITMQLVKNVFLSRNKTISRKIEEALIVWIIENLHLVSKERMFEVYLNIIELGPGIYGIKPASEFYFNKLPKDLTLAESIYLSSIIPRPKAFRYAFVSNGVLRDYLTNYYKLLGGIMVRRNQISPADTINLMPKIKLTGEAQYLLNQQDTTAAKDSLYFQNLTPNNPLF